MSHSVMAQNFYEVQPYLAGSRWEGWSCEAMFGDASARRYFRLRSSPMTSKGACASQSVIVMDARGEVKGHTDHFNKVTRLLHDQGLAAPKVFMNLSSVGLMVLEDLGADDVKSCLWGITSHSEQGHEKQLKGTILQVLERLHYMPAPQGFAVLTPDHAAQMCDVAWEFYAGIQDFGPYVSALGAVFQDVMLAETSVALRDFHAENLIWRPERHGLSKLGLLDYQDALCAPIGYDLVSFVKDVRQDVPPEFAADMIAQFASCIQVDLDVFEAHCACVSVQRNLRILGVFSRLALTEHKQKYLEFLPRVRHLIATDLQHPALSPLQDMISTTLLDLEYPRISEFP